MANVLVNAEANLSSVLDKLDECEAFITTNDQMFDWDGNNLEKLLVRRGHQAYRTGVLLNELKSLEDFVEIKVKEVESIHWKKYNENHGRTLTTRDIQAYIAGEPDYVSLRTLQTHITFQKRQLENTFELLKSVGYDLKNITLLRVHEITDAMVFV